MNNSLEKWLAMQEILEYINVSRQTILNWITDKNMFTHKIGKMWCFKASEVDTWTKSGGAE